MQTWKLQDAKAQLSEVIRRAKRKPQMLTVRGKEEVVVLSKHQYQKLSQKKPSLPEFFKKSPLFGISLGTERDKSSFRNVEL